MKAAVTHINLLQRTPLAHGVAWALAALLVLTVTGAVMHGGRLRAQAQEAIRQRDDVALQVKQAQAQIGVQSGEQTKSAAALALRKQADALQPQALVARALIDAVRNAEGGRTDEFARPLVAVTGLNVPGLWLTNLVVSAGDKRMELQGEARNGAAVLRFARRANEALQPLNLRLDSLEMTPAAAGAASGASAGAVSFKLR